MKQYKLNKKYLAALLVLVTILLLAARVIMMLLMGEVKVGEEPSSIIELILVPIFFIVSMSYLYSAIMMIRQYRIHSGTAFTVTEAGIENTFTALNLLAFIFVSPIKCIPWNAIQRVEKTDKHYVARLDLAKVQAGRIAKLALTLMGYRFCAGFTSDEILNDKRIKAKIVK